MTHDYILTCNPLREQFLFQSRSLIFPASELKNSFSKHFENAIYRNGGPGSLGDACGLPACHLDRNHK